MFAVIAAGCGDTFILPPESGTCGDGVVDTASEACDDGTETRTCDVDCTAAECGDGLLNEAAGEECEDGNADDGDGCDSSCQFETRPPVEPPTGCEADPDPDACAVCGDGIVTPSIGEECDGGDDCNGPTEANACRHKTSAFRISTFECVDPSALALTCVAVQTLLTFDGLVSQEQADGARDLSFMILQEPLVQSDGTSGGGFVIGDCAANEADPFAPSACSISEDAEPTVALQFNVKTTGDCLVPPAVPLGPWAETFGKVEAGDHGCFVTDPTDLTLAVGPVLLPLKEFQLAGQYDGTPATSFGNLETTNAMLVGFIRREDTQGDPLPIFEVTLEQLLMGSDPTPDIGPGGAEGWWIHISVAGMLESDWSGGPLCGNGVLDADEACDPAVAAGQSGACDTLYTCSDADECTEDRLIQPDPCNPSCAFVPYTALNPPPAGAMCE